MLFQFNLIRIVNISVLFWWKKEKNKIEMKTEQLHDNNRWLYLYFGDS